MIVSAHVGQEIRILKHLFFVSYSLFPVFPAWRQELQYFAAAMASAKYKINTIQSEVPSSWHQGS